MAKKDFTKNNPALAYISTENSQESNQETTATAKKTGEAKKPLETAPQKKRQAPGKPPKGYKINYDYVEVKSQRVNLLLQPSVVAGIKKLAKRNKMSVNETISQIIIEKLESEGL